MMRMPFLITWAGLLMARYPATAAGQPAKQPNVIIIMTDDQGLGDFSFTGNPVLKTPNMDRLARESVRFTDFHVCPMCDRKSTRLNSSHRL